MSDLVTVPGVLLDLDDAAYHGDRGSLSSSGARALLDGTPARFRWEQDHGRADRKTFDVGHIVHTKVLGNGMPAEVPCDAQGVPYVRWDSNDSKAAVARIREAGRVPLKADEYAEANAMAEALLAHPIAGRLLAAGGVAEQSLFWQDEVTGVWLRARPDWTTDLAVLDVKTTKDGSRRGFRKAVAEYGYHQQQPWYVGGLVALDLGARPFMFAVVEKTPPYLANVHVLDDEAIAVGHDRNRRAIDLYAACLESGEWPGYDVDLDPLNLPAWAAA